MLLGCHGCHVLLIVLHVIGVTSVCRVWILPAIVLGILSRHVSSRWGTPRSGSSSWTRGSTWGRGVAVTTAATITTSITARPAIRWSISVTAFTSIACCWEVSLWSALEFFELLFDILQKIEAEIFGLLDFIGIRTT